MSWRRFSTLLRGLGPNSASASRAQVRRLRLGPSKDDAALVSGTKQQVSAAFSAQFSGIGRKGKKRPGPKSARARREG